MRSNSGRFAGAADAYDHHVGRYGAQLAAALIDVAGVLPGQRVLDVGCKISQGRFVATRA